MNPTPLTSGQQSQIDALVTAGRLRVVATDVGRAERFLELAADALAQIPKLDSSNVQYDVAYNAAHDVGEAVLAAHGLRTGSRDGQHVAVGEVLGIISDTGRLGGSAEVRPGASRAEQPAVPGHRHRPPSHRRRDRDGADVARRLHGHPPPLRYAADMGLGGSVREKLHEVLFGADELDDRYAHPLISRAGAAVAE